MARQRASEKQHRSIRRTVQVQKKRPFARAAQSGEDEFPHSSFEFTPEGRSERPFGLFRRKASEGGGEFRESRRPRVSDDPRRGFAAFEAIQVGMEPDNRFRIAPLPGTGECGLGFLRCHGAVSQTRRRRRVKEAMHTCMKEPERESEFAGTQRIQARKRGSRDRGGHAPNRIVEIRRHSHLSARISCNRSSAAEIVIALGSRNGGLGCAASAHAAASWMVESSRLPFSSSSVRGLRRCRGSGLGSAIS